MSSARAAPDELGVLVVLATLPEGDKAFVNLVCYSGPLEAGELIIVGMWERHSDDELNIEWVRL